MKQRLLRVMNKIENAPSAMAIRNGLVMLIPVLLLGSTMLILKNLPIPAYQRFLADSFFLDIFNFVYNATFGMLSVFATLVISYSYAKEKSPISTYRFGAVLTALMVFFILVGVLKGDTAWGALGPKGMFTAILSSTLTSFLYFQLTRRLPPKIKPFSDGADVEFTKSVGIFLPVLLITLTFAVLNAAVSAVFHVDTLHALFIDGANALFRPFGRSIFSGLLMVLLSSILWFFGIHGSDVLEAVMDTVFTPATQVNAGLLAAGKAPTEILTKEFFDVFIFIGGCGTALCLLVALLLFSKRASNRRLSKMAAMPMLFNINEVMVFGLPVIYNPSLLLPFILTPLVSYFVTYTAMATGIVPLITASVDWTTPALLGGYQATGSVRGSLLQLFNIVLGVLIYRPFVLAYDRKKERRAKRHLDELVAVVQECEKNLSSVTLTELPSVQGEIARSLSADLEYAMSTDALTLYYQPQYDNRGMPRGAEALLRWFHPLGGSIYPPLIIQLAREAGLLLQLEQTVLKQAVQDGKAIWDATGVQSKISVNVSAESLHRSEYQTLLEELLADGAVRGEDLCLEVTEQTALFSSQETEESFARIRQLGCRFAIDDFSMGHTSLSYLQENRFDLVKLDGSIVRGMADNPRCKDIVASIVHLSKSLDFDVLAEYVETEQMRGELEAIGCNLYQGYLFSPALSREDLIARFLQDAAAHEERPLSAASAD